MLKGRKRESNFLVVITSFRLIRSLNKRKIAGKKILL